jgi:ABC-type uncharacterized transport system ATPase subunit
MGVTGAGKTTLMDVLTRKMGGYIERKHYHFWLSKKERDLYS